VSKFADQIGRRRRSRRALVTAAAFVAAAASIAAVLHARGAQRDARPGNYGADVGKRGAYAARTDELPALAAYDGAIPDDTVLQEQLAKAIDLRRREDFDRMLDARDPGELIEHATLTDVAFDHRKLGVDGLFVIGDELFNYLFRPENGWGRGPVDRAAIDFTPQPRRIHRGVAGGPDSFGCLSCHSKGGPDGSGTQTQNAFFRGDGEQLAGADQRNPPQVIGLGPIAVLASEMSADLRAQAAAAAKQARAEGRRVEQALATKGIAFGRIAAEPDGTLDTRGVEGVDADLTVRPFGWKGHQATLRDIAEESLHLHAGLLSKRVQLAIRDDGLDAEPYGPGKWWDVDDDGVSLEIDEGMLSTMVAYLAQLEVPIMRPPHEPGLVEAFAAGRTAFQTIGCAHCHAPTLELVDPKLDARAAYPGGEPHPPFIVDVAKDGDGPKIEPRYGGYVTTYLVHLFSDLKRHDMGPGLATAAPQGTIPAAMFLTRPLWGLADTAPYLHDGRAPTVHEAIVHHGGEAAGARDAYLALDEDGRASVRVFLASLAREPKLFAP
jgi:hypothetical protein